MCYAHVPFVAKRCLLNVAALHHYLPGPSAVLPLDAALRSLPVFGTSPGTLLSSVAGVGLLVAPVLVHARCTAHFTQFLAGVKRHISAATTFDGERGAWNIGRQHVHRVGVVDVTGVAKPFNDER